MNTKTKLLLLDLLIVVIAIFGVFLYMQKFTNYAFVVFAIAIGVGIITFIFRRDNRNPSAKYESSVKNILSTYDSVLVESKKVPKIDDKNVILVKAIGDLIDAQIELRKPIYYFKQTDSCSFTLFDGDQALIYIIKKDEGTLAPIEIEIKNNLLKKKNRNDIDEEILEQINKTTIVKLPNEKSYKVSPVRKKKAKDDIEIL